MKLHNTLTSKIEVFKPNSNEVLIYNCGPTVYDFAHLGNLRAYVFTDTLRRCMEASGYRVKQVMNITDVGHLASDDDEGDDKLEKGARREGKSVWEIAKYYADAFKRDIAILNILSPNGYKDEKHADSYARATDFIDHQIEIVKILIDKNFAYLTEQAIYFDVSKLPSYGEISGQSLKDKATGARAQVIVDESKRGPHDFALWFFTVGRFKSHSMHWPSPWGDGFPGWHLECSAIIHKILGEPIDIHTGGVDHIGTHHANEMAQTEAAFGKKLANFWLHNEHMLVDGKKMSKSLDNFYTLDDVIKKGYDPLALRLLYLQSHYRSQTNFTWEALAAAHNTLLNFYDWSDLQFQQFESRPLEINYSLAMDKIVEAMQNDLATPQALGWFNGMVNRVDNLGIDSGSIKKYVKEIDGYLGLGLSERKDITQDQKNLIHLRERAREDKDWVKSDELRSRLLTQKIEISDTPNGPIWSRLG